MFDFARILSTLIIAVSKLNMFLFCSFLINLLYPFTTNKKCQITRVTTTIVVVVFQATEQVVVHQRHVSVWNANTDRFAIRVSVVGAGAPRIVWITLKWENTSIQHHPDYRLPKLRFSSTTKIPFAEPTGEIIRIYVNYIEHVVRSAQTFKSSLKENAVSLSLIKYKMRLNWRNKLRERKMFLSVAYTLQMCALRAASSWSL